jgi:hypothetical protein
MSNIAPRILTATFDLNLRDALLVQKDWRDALVATLGIHTLSIRFIGMEGFDLGYREIHTWPVSRLQIEVSQPIPDVVLAALASDDRRFALTQLLHGGMSLWRGVADVATDGLMRLLNYARYILGQPVSATIGHLEIASVPITWLSSDGGEIYTSAPTIYRVDLPAVVARQRLGIVPLMLASRDAAIDSVASGAMDVRVADSMLARARERFARGDLGAASIELAVALEAGAADTMRRLPVADGSAVKRAVTRATGGRAPLGDAPSKALALRDRFHSLIPTAATPNTDECIRRVFECRNNSAHFGVFGYGAHDAPIRPTEEDIQNWISVVSYLVVLYRDIATRCESHVGDKSILPATKLRTTK